MDGWLLQWTGIYQVRAFKGKATKYTSFGQGKYITHALGIFGCLGHFLFAEISGSDKRFFVKKNNEQKCRAIFDEKRPSGLKRKSGYTPSLKAKEP